MSLENEERATKFRKVITDGAEEFVCPITQELPVDPVTAEDGRVYERNAIEKWLKKHKKSPYTNEKMGTKLLPATQVRNMIESMVRSGAISGDKAGEWKKKLKDEEVLHRLRRRAETDSNAMAELSNAYIAGKYGLQKDVFEHFKWAKRAADLDNPLGIFIVSLCVYHGRGTVMDKNKSECCAVRTGSDHGYGLRVLHDGADLFVWQSRGTQGP